MGNVFEMAVIILKILQETQGRAWTCLFCLVQIPQFFRSLASIHQELQRRNNFLLRRRQQALWEHSSFGRNFLTALLTGGR